MENMFFSARVGILMFDAIPLESTFPYLYLDLACKQLCFPPGKGINRRNESTISELFTTVSQLLFCSTDDIQPVFIHFLFFPQLEL